VPLAAEARAAVVEGRVEHDEPVEDRPQPVHLERREGGGVGKKTRESR
jgi:hypothetical protein